MSRPAGERYGPLTIRRMRAWACYVEWQGRTCEQAAKSRILFSGSSSVAFAIAWPNQNLNIPAGARGASRSRDDSE